MEILVMDKKHYNEVYTLWNETPGIGMRSLDDSEIGIAKFLDRNPNTNFICRIDDKLVGVIMCGHDGRRGYIYHTAVHENYRKMGIGKALVDSAINSLRNEGINKVALVVFSDNQLGNAFWQALGFDVRDDITYRNLSINSVNI